MKSSHRIAAKALCLPRLRRAGDSESVSGMILSTSFKRIWTLIRLTTCSPHALALTLAGSL